MEADQVLPDRREKGSERMRQTQALQAPPTPKKTPRPIIDAINRAPREELGASLGVSFGSSEIGEQGIRSLFVMYLHVRPVGRTGSDP